ncbi:MAG: rod shape-determining protein [Acidobacteria bacterium]|nr:rod shape-determining protein [Acidobacteriota bacterium]
MIWRTIRNWFVNDLAIDLGTVNTLIYSNGAGIILREPSSIATNKYTGQVVALGREAEVMLGREPYGVTIHHPLQDGTIADFDLAEKMLKGFIRRSCGRRGKRLRVLLALPTSATDVERNALYEAAERAGANHIDLVDEGLAAALGTGNISDGRSRMIVDIGGGTTNFSIVSEHGLIFSWCLKIAGTELTESIVAHARHNYHTLISFQAAESAKWQLGSAQMSQTPESVEIIGKSTADGSPKTINFTNADVSQSIEKSLQAIIEGVRYTLLHTSPDVTSDIYRAGVTIAGGGSLLKNLDLRLQTELGIPVIRAEHPLEAVALGAGKLVENPELRQKLDMFSTVSKWEGTVVPEYNLIQ